MTPGMPEPTSALEQLDLDQGGGPPVSLLPWTLIVESEDWSADLEHGTTLPRVGEQIEYIEDDATRRMLRVDAVVYTVQKSARERPPVRDEAASPNAMVTGGTTAVRPTALRAGLPRVYVTPLD